jgi:hypothetical protein
MASWRVPSNIWKKVVFCIDGIMVVAQQHMKKVVFCIDGMMVGCPATYEKVVLCIDGIMVGAQQHRKKWCSA